MKRQEEILATFDRLQPSAPTDLSVLPQHLADSGMRDYEQSSQIIFTESEEKELQLIREAFRRIEENTYGICEKCENLIKVERLKIVPYARLCIKCEREEEV